MNFKLFGVSFDLSFQFFLVLSAFLFFDRTGTASIVIISIIIHEFGHMMAMLLSGARIKSVQAMAFGIRIEQKHCATLSYIKEMLIFGAGALLNLFAAGATALFSNPNWNSFVAINAVMAVFNLIPINPLDGGAIIKILTRNALNERSAGLLCLIISVLMLVPLFVASIFLFLSKKNFSLLIAVFYLSLNLFSDYR